MLSKADYKAKSREIGGVYREYFGRHYPAMTLVEVKRLYDDDCAIEIEGVAVLDVGLGAQTWPHPPTLGPPMQRRAVHARHRPGIPRQRVTTGLAFDGHRIAAYRGVVRGITVRSRNVVATIGATVQTLFGGNISLYTALCERAREEAFELMRDHAAAIGANAIVAMRYDANDVAPGVTEVLAYGTAAVIEAGGDAAGDSRLGAAARRSRTRRALDPQAPRPDRRRPGLPPGRRLTRAGSPSLHSARGRQVRGSVRVSPRAPRRGPAPGEHETYYRYTVLGYVKDAAGKQGSGISVELVSEKTGFSYLGETDGSGLYVIVTRLGDESVGERLRLRAGSQTVTVLAQFDPDDHTRERGTRVDFDGPKPVETPSAFAATLKRFLDE